jgi:hypothetical protein
MKSQFKARFSLTRFSFLAFLFAYSLSVIGNPRLSLARASGDDGIIAHVYASMFIDVFENDQIANGFRHETTNSMMNWIPYIAFKTAGVNPEFFWYLFLILQITLPAVSLFLISTRYLKSTQISFFVMVVMLNVRPQMLNLSFSGDLEWMPYAGWLAISFAILSAYFYIKGKNVHFVIFNVIASLIHPTLGIWILSFTLFTFLISKGYKTISANERRISIFLIAVGCSNLFRIYIYSKEKLAKDVPDNYLASVLSNGHFNALNIFELTKDQNQLLAGNLLAIIGLLIFYISNVDSMRNLLDQRISVLLKSALYVAGLGIAVQIFGIIFQNPFLLRTLGTRFTSFASTLLFLFLLITLIVSSSINKYFKGLSILFILFFPGAITFLLIGTLSFLMNFGKLGKAKTLICINSLFVAGVGLFLTLKIVLASAQEQNFNNINALLSESHLVSRNYFLERLPIFSWPVIFILFVFAFVFMQEKHPTYSNLFIGKKKVTAVLIILISLLFVDGRYVNSSKRFNERESKFVEVQKWARVKSIPSSRFYIQSSTVYEGWRNYSLRPRTYLTAISKPYAFYKSDLQFFEIYSRREKIYGRENLEKPTFNFLEAKSRELKIDYLICDVDFDTGDGRISFRNAYFKVIKFG